jgi:hypothetical protein
MIKEQLEIDFKEALKAKNESVVSTLRMLRAATMNKAIELMKKDEGLNEEETIALIRSEVKKLKDAIVDYEKGGRMDLAESAKNEIEIMKKYLPPEMGEEEIRAVIVRVVAANPGGEMGRVMGEAMKELKGKADGAMVRSVLQEELGKTK